MKALGHDAVVRAVGPELAALIAARGVDVAHVGDVTTLPAARRVAGAFRVELVDGTCLKARLMPSAARAREVAALLAQAGECFPAVLGLRDHALLLEWVGGELLTDPRPRMLRRCGALLGALHTRPVPAELAAEARAALRDPDAFRARLEQQIGALRDTSVLAADVARAAVARAACGGDADASIGIAHGDLCGENVVAHPTRGPVSIDNGNLAVGHLDYDLARTFYRWPLHAAQRAIFLEGYATRRSPATFLREERFWMLCAIVVGASVQHAFEGPGLAATLRCLRLWIA
jgi:aminoglycoside phosphotransferase (APT) family kinase protein